MKFKRLLILSFALILFALSGAYIFYFNELQKPLNTPEKGLTVEVFRGDSLNAVLARLKNLGLFESIWVAKAYSKQNHLDEKIRVGEYEIPQSTTIPQLFALLTSNRQLKYSITLIEGTTFKQALNVVAEHPQLDHTLEGKSDLMIMDLLATAKTPRLFNNAPSDFQLEGLLYPDTYFFQKYDTDLSILIRAHKRLLSVLEQEWSNRQKSLPLKSAYDALILASIVEKETGAAEERGKISGVFIRRLEANMRLQTDPTVIYGLGERYQGNIKRKHLKELTPYNTYRIKGLPPTPIALVGRAAIYATLHPEVGQALYFVAKGDGTHQFSASIEEHNRAVRKYQLKRRVDYRSVHQQSSKGVN